MPGHDNREVTDGEGNYSLEDYGMPVVNTADAEDNPDSEEFRSNSEAESYDEHSALECYGTDITGRARNGELDPVIGREPEIERIIEALLQKKKNNAMLVGDAGVGKTAVVEGLAQALLECGDPELSNKRVISLDMGLILAGTMYRGQFEERVKNIIKEAKADRNVVLFVDEFHTIIGSGGSSSAAEMIKPELARGDIQMVGATTMSEYRKYVEKDAALSRRFKIIEVKEPSEEDTVAILMGVKSRYEEHHKVSYSDEAIKAVAALSSRYMKGRNQPDAALDVLDEAGSRAMITASGWKISETPVVRSSQEKIVEELKKVCDRLSHEDLTREKKQELIKKRTELVLKNDMDNVEMIREGIMPELEEVFLANERSAEVVVDLKLIEDTVASITGVPVQSVTATESQRVLALPARLGEQVIGQKHAIEEVCRAIRLQKSGLKNPNRPIGTFLFMGPTGVGKTHLAKTLTAELMGDKKAILQFDMSEYMEKHDVSKLIGSPPGYVGHQEGGVLSEKVKNNPYSVVLFDEIEKAHPDIANLLLQVLEEGRLTDGQGREIDFTNTVIILTTNVGAEVFSPRKSIGFKEEESVIDAVIDDEDKRNGLIQDALRQRFAPEFINRLTPVLFRALSKEDLEAVLEIELEEAFQLGGAVDLEIDISSMAKTFVIEKGTDVSLGARPLKRAIQKYIIDPLSEELLIRGINNQKYFTITLNENGDGLIIEAGKKGPRRQTGKAVVSEPEALQG